jgi:3-deoxy-D-manno-octulosonate 8-phosphate phosphatase KdsC-like HAD superfamily phosphatase
MGDSFQDAPILKAVDLGICTSDSSFLAKKYADYITPAAGGHRAVADAVFFLLWKWFNVTPDQLLGMKVN